jgi:hypothetical protein
MKSVVGLAIHLVRAQAVEVGGRLYLLQEQLEALVVIMAV